MKIIFTCGGCGTMFNGREQYDKTGEVHCPHCGFLVFREPGVNVYKKSRTRKDLPPLPQINMSDWRKKERRKAYLRERKEEDKEKEERG